MAPPLTRTVHYRPAVGRIAKLEMSDPRARQPVPVDPARLLGTLAIVYCGRPSSPYARHSTQRPNI